MTVQGLVGWSHGLMAAVGFVTRAHGRARRGNLACLYPSDLRHPVLGGGVKRLAVGSCPTGGEDTNWR
eukprot:186943-Chlamydomonas_euryale.AAC.1